MTQQFTDNVLINCDCDETQLKVQGTPGQTQSLQEWVDSEGQVLARITAEGQLEASGLDFGDGTVEGDFSSLSADTVDINGGTIDGTTIGGTTCAAGNFTTGTFRTAFISEAAATRRSLFLNTGSLKRWEIDANQISESGGNAGSNFEIVNYNDAGSVIGAALTITRSSGAVTIPGALSKGSGTFKIDHPLDPERMWLYHSFIEGPRCDLIYRGEVQLVDGQAAVELNAESRMRPGTFEALTQNPQVFLQNHSGWEPVRGRVENDTLLIECRDETSTDSVVWLVIAERADTLIRAWELTDDNGRLVPEHPKTVEESTPMI